MIKVYLIETEIFRGKYALIVSMDMQGAFDNLKTESIIKGMKKKLYPQKNHYMVQELFSKQKCFY